MGLYCYTHIYLFWSYPDAMKKLNTGYCPAYCTPKTGLEEVLLEAQWHDRPFRIILAINQHIVVRQSKHSMLTLKPLGV